MTDEQIIKALECCIFSECENCPHNEETSCTEILHQEMLDLINRHKAEIELWKEEASSEGCANEWLRAHLKNAKTEAIKEFAEKVKANKNRLFNYIYCERGFDEQIDNLVKEMVSDNNA